MVNLEDLPIYDHLDDLVLIGTMHTLDHQRNKEKTLRFIREFKGTKHLILEGYKRNYEQANYPNYEHLAYLYGKKIGCKTINFLDEEGFFIEKNGLRKDLYGLYCLGHSIRIIKYFLGDFSLQKLPGLLKTLEKKESLFDSQEVECQFKEISNNCNLDDFYLLADEWIGHSRCTLDHYVFGPKSKKWKEELEGKKVEVVGYNHFLFLQKYLRGEEVEPLKHWHDTLDGKLRELAEEIENVLFPEVFCYG